MAGKVEIEFGGIISMVVAGHSRPKDGVAFARLCPAIHVSFVALEKKAVDARDKPGREAEGIPKTGFPDRPV
jgi:hypothetical protein